MEMLVDLERSLLFSRNAEEILLKEDHNLKHFL